MEGKSFFLNLNMKIAILKVTRSNSLIIFHDLNIGLECSSNFENVIIRITCINNNLLSIIPCALIVRSLRFWHSLANKQ